MSEKEYVKIIKAMDQFLGVAKEVVDAHEGEEVEDGIDTDFYNLLLEIMKSQVAFKQNVRRKFKITVMTENEP